jgi:PKD repeat protein
MISVEVSRPSSEKPNQILLDASRSYDTDINADTGLVYSWKIDNTDVALEKSKENGAIGYHTFSTVGVHTVSLSLTNAYGKTKTITKDITIDSILSIDMDISPRAAPLGSIVAFDAVSPGAYFYTWKYGDGESSAGTQSSSRHIYKKSGIYDMSVSVTDQDGKTSNTLTRKVYVTNVDEPFAIFDIRKDGNIVEPISGICDAGDAFLADRAGSMTIDGSSSVNIDGTRNNLSYTWKYQGEYQSGPTFSKKFEDIGCFPVTLTVKSNQNGAVHTTTRYIAVKNLLPKLSNISIQKDDTKKDNQKIIVTATANNARDADGVITSYMWYYTTESDPEPQDIKILQKNSATFVLPNITEKYFFGVILEDNDGAKMNSIDTITEKIPFITANEETSIYLPLISVSASSNKVKVGDTITYIASAKTLI